MDSNYNTETPLVNQNYQLTRYKDKKGWMYISFPEIMQERHAFFNWIKVKGSIDGLQISNIHLMPLPNGTLFLPVQAEICEKTYKKEGDWVHVILFVDQTPTDIPEELMLRLKDCPTAYQTFLSLTGSLQQGIIDWIYSAQNDALKFERISKTMKRLTL